MAGSRPQKAPGSIIPITPTPGGILDPKSRVKLTLERLFSDLNSNTLRAYQRSWDMLAEYLGLPSRVEAAAYVTKLNGGEANAMAMEWMAELKKDEKNKAATIAARIAALKGITKRLRIVGLITWTIEVKAPQVTKYKDTSGPGTDAVQKVVETLRQKTDLKAIRDLAIIHALYTTCLRRGELAALALKDLDLPKNKIWITGKGRDDEQSVTIPPKAKESIEAWLKVRPSGSDAVFLSLDPNHYGRQLSDNGIWRITTSYGLGRPHGIRHCGITRVLDKSNGNIRMAQELSRHKDPKTLMLYDDNRKDLAGEASNILDQDL